LGDNLLSTYLGWTFHNTKLDTLKLLRVTHFIYLVTTFVW